MVRRFSILYTFLSLYFLINLQLFPEGTIKSEDDVSATPSVLFDLASDDARISLFWLGYWKLSLRQGQGFLLTENGPVESTSFGSMEDGFNFDHSPDLQLSLWVDEQVYFEMSFIDDYDRNTFLVGYQAKEDDTRFLKQIKVGNTDIGSLGYYDVEIPTPDYNSTGALVRMESENSQHEILGRTESSGTGYREYIGYEEIFTEEIAFTDFIKGRSFRLPQTEIENMEVYLEDPEGGSVDSEGTRWKRVYEGTYAWLPHSGELRLAESAEKRVAVYYTSQGKAVGSSQINDSYLVLVNSDGDLEEIPFYWEADNEWDPEERSFSETRSVFIDNRQMLILYHPSQWGPFENAGEYEMSQIISDAGSSYDYVIEGLVSRNPDLPDRMTFDINERIVRFSFSSESSGSSVNRFPFYELYPDLYRLPLTLKDEDSPYTLVIQTREERSGIQIDEEIVPGTLKVFVNSTETKSFEYSEETGEVEFSRLIFSADHIELFYETPNGTQSRTTLFQGNKLRLSPEWELELSEKIVWDFSKQISQPGEEQEGVLGLTTTLLQDTGRLQSSLSHTEAFTVSNSAGILELAGMDGERLELSLQPARLAPVTGSNTGFDDSSRAPLLYYDYSYTSGGTSYYFPYSSEEGTLSASQEGPFPANTDEDIDDPEGYVAYFDYSLPGGEWSAGDIYLSDESLNLSRQTALEFTVKKLSGNNELRYFLDWGEPGETSDFQDDGSINRYDSSLTCRHEITSSMNGLTTGEWKTVKLLLDDSMKRKMSSVRQLRLIIVNEEIDPDPVKGSFIITAPATDGTSFLTTQGDGLAVETSESGLYTQYPDLQQSDSESNKSLLLYWNKDGFSPDTEICRYFSTTEIYDYRRLVFYIKGGNSASEVTLSLQEDGTERISATLTPVEGKWQKVTINLDSGTAECDSGTAVTVAQSPGRTADTLVISSSGPEESTLLLDEIRLESPEMNWETDTRLSLSYLYDDDFFAGGRQFSLTFDGTHQYAPFAETESDLYSSSLYLESFLDFPWSTFSLSGDIVYASSVLDVTPGYQWELPAPNPWFYLSHQYAADNSGASMNREEIIYLGIPELLSLNTTHRTYRNGTDRNQSWQTVLSQGYGGIYSLETGVKTSHQSETMLPSGNWGENWINDWAHLIPDFKQSSSRSILSWAGINLDTEYVSLQPSFQFRTMIYPGEEYLVQNSWSEDYRISFYLFHAKPTQWTLTPFYTRQLNQEGRTGVLNSLSNDFSQSLHLLEYQFPLINYPFFTEIEETAQWERLTTSDSELDQWNYRPSFGLDISRTQFGGWIDLFLFQTLTGSYSSHYAKTGTGFTEISTLELGGVQRSINLWGSKGTHPLFNWYESDELQNSLQTAWEDTDSGLFQLSWTSWQSYLQVWEEGNDYFKLNTNLNSDWLENTLENENSLLFHWEKQGGDYLYISLFDWVIDNPWSSWHEESADFEITLPTGQWTEAENFSILMTHTSALNLKGTGVLKGWLSIGLLYEDALYTGAYEIGLELTIQL